MRQQPPVINFPLRGVWKTIRSPGHDRFAFDFAAISGQHQHTLAVPFWRHLLFQVPVQHSYSWSQPVFSPGLGRIVQAQDGWPDRPELNLLTDIWRLLLTRPRIERDDIRPFAGNYVILQMADVFAFLAHLRSGSIKVKVGQSVSTEEILGEVGHSGFTLAPHLHFQVMNAENAVMARILPFRVQRYECWTGQSWEIIENGILTKGELIRVTKG